MLNGDAWSGTCRPHKPRRPEAALYKSLRPKYTVPHLTGNNNHDPTKYKAPMYSFGIRHHQASTECSPGPRYLIPSNTTRMGQDGTPAFSLQGRPKDQKVFSSPGPGKYSPENSQKWMFSSSPAYTLSGKSKEMNTCQTPGPAAYSLPPVFGARTVGYSAAPCYSICGRCKTGVFNEDLKKSPGPAAYKVVDPYFFQTKPPHFSMVGRNYPPGDHTQKPGPGAYYPERVTTTRATGPSFTFGLRHSQFVVPFNENVSEEP